MLIPLGYRVLLEPEDLEETTPGGIVIPDSVRDKERLATQVGTILAIGDEAWSDAKTPWAGPGDKVMFAKYAQKRIKDPYSEQEYIICNDEDIICLVETKEQSNG